MLIDTGFYSALSKSIPTHYSSDFTIKGYVKFDDDGKVIVNPYLSRDDSSNYSRIGMLYYTLKNRQSIRLKFREFTVSAVTIPIKYRFKREGAGEEFSTGVNGNVFVGYSWGWTSFFHQSEVGNISNTGKFTFGALFGASSVTLTAANTSQAAEPLTAETTKGLGSLGIGCGYSFNKLNFGVFCGADYAIGKDAGKWNYNRRPWLGIALGYSLLNF